MAQRVVCRGGRIRARQKKMLISLALSMPLTTTTVGAGAVARRLHEQRRQRGALVRHLDELDVRMAQPDALVPDFIGDAAPLRASSPARAR